MWDFGLKYTSNFSKYPLFHNRIIFLGSAKKLQFKERIHPVCVCVCFAEKWVIFLTCAFFSEDVLLQRCHESLHSFLR